MDVNVITQEVKQELKRQNQIEKLDVANNALDAIGNFVSMNIVLFRHLVEKRNGPLFNSLLGYLFLPVAFLAATLNSIFSIRRAIVKKGEGHAVAKAVMETIAATTLAAAIIGLIAATSLFIFVAPLIYASVVLAKALFSAGSAIYFGTQARDSLESDERAQLRDKCKNAIVDALLGAVLAGAMFTLVLVAAPAVQIAMTILGVTASIFAYAFSRVKIQYPADHYHPEFSPTNEEESNRTNNADVNLALGHTNSSYVSFSSIMDAQTIEAEEKEIVPAPKEVSVNVEQQPLRCTK